MERKGTHGHPIDPERVAMARDRVLSDAAAAELADLFDVLKNPARTRIVSALAAAEELCVGDIALAIGASENSVSYALRQLRATGVVSRRRAGRVIYYRLRVPRLRELIELATALRQGA